MGSPLLSYGKQTIEFDDMQAVGTVMAGDYLTQGPEVGRFEQALETVTGARYATVTANGTLALELVYSALGLGPGSRLWTSAITFLASATAALRVGADVRFLDVEPATASIDPDEARTRLESGERVDAITVVHFAGRVSPMGRWIELKREFGFRLVEDACHSLGARYFFEGEWWGAGAHPEVDAATLSFHPVKVITTGEGGAVLSSDSSLVRRVRQLASHGIDRRSKLRPFGNEPGGEAPSWWGPMLRLGTNARLSDMQAALGVSQTAKLGRFVGRRRELAASYRGALKESPFELLDPGDGSHEHAWHLFVVLVDPEDRDALWEHLEHHAIRPQLHYYPVPLQPWFAERLPVRSYPNAEKHARSATSLPIYPTLTDFDQERVLGALASFAANVS